MRTIFRSNKDILTFAEEIKSVVLAKTVVMERMLTTAKELCEDSRVVTETAARDGEEYRKSLKDPSQKWKFQDAKAQRASVKELRQMVTFLTEKEVPIGKADTTHFERFALFSKLELQKALAVIRESNQSYIELLEYFGEDKNTQVGDFFALLDSFLAEFDRVADMVEKEEEEKLKAARRKLTKQAKEKVKSAYKSASGVDAQHDGDGDAKPRKTWRENPILKSAPREKKGDKPTNATSAAEYTMKQSQGIVLIDHAAAKKDLLEKLKELQTCRKKAGVSVNGSSQTSAKSMAVKLQRTKVEQGKLHANVARMSQNRPPTRLSIAGASIAANSSNHPPRLQALTAS